MNTEISLFDVSGWVFGFVGFVWLIVGEWRHRAARRESAAEKAALEQLNADLQEKFDRLKRQYDDLKETLYGRRNEAPRPLTPSRVDEVLELIQRCFAADGSASILQVKQQAVEGRISPPEIDAAIGQLESEGRIVRRDGKLRRPA